MDSLNVSAWYENLISFLLEKDSRKGWHLMNEDGHLDWGAGSQQTDLLEDLDALVDPETQRIIDEADLLEYVRLSLPPCVI